MFFFSSSKSDAVLPRVPGRLHPRQGRLLPPPPGLREGGQGRAQQQQGALGTPVSHAQEQEEGEGGVVGTVDLFFCQSGTHQSWILVFLLGVAKGGSHK